MFLESRARPARKADSLTVICELIAILSISQPHEPPRPVNGDRFYLIRGICCGVMSWVDLAECKNQYRALVKAAMNHRSP
jgi:hypothetical protein